MKCHWAVEDGKKYWIPGCWDAAVNPKEDGCCYCRKVEKQKSPNPKKIYERENEYLLKENAALNRIIEKLTNKNV